MLPVIHNSAKEMASVLDYNLDKEDEEVARPVFGNGLPSLEQEEVIAYFEKWSHKSISTDRLSFHMSINPSDTDESTDEDIRGYVTELMDGLGYGQQPYVVFEHSDIKRRHFHVVSIRVDKDGRKIKDSNEKYKCKSITQSLEKKYHFKYGKDTSKERKIKSGESFGKGEENVMERFRSILKKAFSYYFTTAKQFEIIAAHFGLKLRQTDLTMEKEYTLQGMDPDGNGCTRPVSEAELGARLYGQAKEAGERNRESGAVKRKEKERIAGIAGSLLKYAASEEAFVSMLKEKDIDLVLTRSDDGRVFGFTVVDHTTKCAFKGSEIGKDFTLQMIKDRMEEWKKGSTPKAPEQKTVPQRKPSRKQKQVKR